MANHMMGCNSDSTTGKTDRFKVQILGSKKFRRESNEKNSSRTGPIPSICLRPISEPAVFFRLAECDTIFVDKNATGVEVAPPGGMPLNPSRKAVLSSESRNSGEHIVAQGVYYENNIVLSEGIKLYGSFEERKSLPWRNRRDVWDNSHCDGD